MKKWSHHTEKSKLLLSLSKLGKPSYVRTLEHRIKMSRKLLGKKFSNEHKKNISIALTGHKAFIGNQHALGNRFHLTEEQRNKIGQAQKGKKRPSVGIKLKGIVRSDETKMKLSVSRRKSWLRPEYREKVIKGMLKGMLIRPTSLEKSMIDIIQKYQLQYRYTGDGDVIIGGKNPDFINTDGAKVCIEVGNKFHHQGNYIEARKAHFAQYGYETVVFITDNLKDLSEDHIVSTIKQAEKSWKQNHLQA